MLQDIRDNTQGVIAKVIIGLIVAVFALFGVESIIGGFISSPPVAEVNGEEITEAQLQFNTQNLLTSLGASGDFDQTLLEQIALNQLIEEAMMRQTADRSNMIVSSDRIDRSIIDNPQFQINGVFDGDLAVRTMASQGYNVPLYRDALNQTMLMGQLVNAFTSSNFVTDAELETVAELTQQTRDFRYVSITLGTRTLGTPISDEEITRYYEENIDNFTEPESVIAEYVILDKDIIANEIAVDEADVLAQYETERGEYEGSSEKRAAHILFDIGSSSEAETIELAASVRQRILDGEDFGALALEYSVDTVSAEADGDIGYTDGTAFPEPIEAALNALAVDEISEPVVSEFGVHLVKLTEDDTREFQSFEEVSARIERDLKSAQVDQIYAGRLEDLSNLAFETGDLQTISDEFGLEIQLSEAVFRSGNSGLFSNSALSNAAFSDEVLLEGNNSDVIELNDSRSVVLRVEQFNEARPLPLEDVQAEIAVILRTEMEREAVQELGEELLIAVESGNGLDELMAENGLQWVEANGTDRSAFNVNRELVTHVFAEPAPLETPAYSSVTLSNDTFVLVELNAVNVGTVANMDEASRTQLVTQMKSDFGGADLSSYIINLRENSDISAPMLEEEQF